MRALRIYHSGVVPAWRERDRELRRHGVDVRLIAAQRWNEGGSDVAFDAGNDDFACSSRTAGRHPYRFLYDPRPIWSTLRKLRPEVIDCHEEPASLAAFEVLVIRALTRSKAPVLFYGAQNIEKRFPPPFRWIERWALRSAAGVYCCNAEAGEIFRRKGFAGVVHVMGLGVDLHRFSPARHSTPHPPFRLGFVGRLEWRKGIPIVIEALAGLPDHFELHVHGTGPDDARLRLHAAAQGVAGRVHFHGFANQDELPAIYRSLHAVVVPSQTTENWVEQFGRVVVEAMACGVPVIGSDSGSIPEVIGDAGIVVPEADVAAWRHAIERLAGDEHEQARLHDAGLAHVERYTWEAIARTHRQLYEEATA